MGNFVYQTEINPVLIRYINYYYIHANTPITMFQKSRGWASTMILIVDDDELVVALVRQALESCGYIVGAVDDGVSVIGIVELKRPELVILDCGLPTFPGIEALRQIRLSATCFDTPVLVLTGRRGEADEAIAIRAGADDYLRKPFDCDNLIVRAEQLIARARARKEALNPPLHPWIKRQSELGAR